MTKLVKASMGNRYRYTTLVESDPEITASFSNPGGVRVSIKLRVAVKDGETPIAFTLELSEADAERVVRSLETGRRFRDEPRNDDCHCR